jgi:hypothetical protein
MALFGTRRDIGFFKSISTELVDDIITTPVGYYKPILESTKSNLYGESSKKTFTGPVLVPCLVERGDYTATTDNFGPDAQRNFKFRFLRDTLIHANIYPEVGDIVMFNELYFEITSVNQNQLILGKDNEYPYADGLEDYGDNYSIILTGHYTRGDKLGITEQR